jgi:quercetin dioxygenase-like cupin family protein
MPTRHEQNEARVLHFSRELVGDGVHVANVGLRRGENSMPHLHTTTRDTFFVMAGRLVVEVRVDGEAPSACYRGLFSTPPEIRPNRNHGAIHSISVRAGEVLIIEPGVVHCAMNLDDEPTRFLCIEGVGEYDFVEV